MATTSGRTPAPLDDSKDAATRTSDNGANGPAKSTELSQSQALSSKGGGRDRPVRVRRRSTLEESLYQKGYSFDFFQAIRLLERLAPERRPVGRGGGPGAEATLFRAHLSLSFPASPIASIEPSRDESKPPTTVVTFMGLTGPKGSLPAHYTELLLRLEKEGIDNEKNALRDWLDIFNHRMVALFFWAWKKYRFYIPYEKSEYANPEPDPFTRSLLSLIGLGIPSLRDRLKVTHWEKIGDQRQERVLAKIDDVALLRYAGLLAHRPRCAISLEALLADYFRLPVKILQFQGQWLYIDPINQSRLGGMASGNNQLGVNAVAGEHVWDVESKFRIRLGPLSDADFNEFLPDHSPTPERKRFFLLTNLVRLYVGLEFDFDVQLVLKAPEIPECQLAPEGDAIGPRLGWNTWACSIDSSEDAEDAVFDAEENIWTADQA